MQSLNQRTAPLTKGGAVRLNSIKQLGQEAFLVTTPDTKSWQGGPMRRAERLFRLVNEMQTRDVCRAEDLAEQFEVSVRTVYRDIAHLQASGLPIEGEPGIGYLLRPGFELPNLTFTHDQVDALAVGLSFVESTADATLASAAREVRAKLQASMPEPKARKLADAPFFAVSDKANSIKHAEMIRQAIRSKIVLEVGYLNGQGQSSKRRVRPLAMWSYSESWMFSGWCELKQDFRTFRFDRIDGLELTDELFEEDESTNLSAFMNAENH